MTLTELFGATDISTVVLFCVKTTSDRKLITELAAMRLEKNTSGKMVSKKSMNLLINQPAYVIPENEGIKQVTEEEASNLFGDILVSTDEKPVLMCAFNAQLELSVVSKLLRGKKLNVQFLDALTICRDRYPGPYSVLDALNHYNAAEEIRTGEIEKELALNSVLGLGVLIGCMGQERNDVLSYINLIGMEKDRTTPGKPRRGIVYCEQTPVTDEMAPIEKSLPQLISNAPADRLVALPNGAYLVSIDDTKRNNTKARG